MKFPLPGVKFHSGPHGGPGARRGGPGCGPWVTADGPLRGCRPRLIDALFSDPVRVRWDLPRLLEVATARLEAVTDVGTIAGWHLPWYENGDGQLTVFDDPDGAPLTVAAGAARFLGTSREAAINAWAAQLVWGATFMVVTYGWGGPERIVVDGCHRSVATARTAHPQRPVRVANFALTGPLDPGLVADLTWWARR